MMANSSTSPMQGMGGGAGQAFQQGQSMFPLYNPILEMLKKRRQQGNQDPYAQYGQMGESLGQLGGLLAGGWLFGGGGGGGGGGKLATPGMWGGMPNMGY